MYTNISEWPPWGTEPEPEVSLAASDDVRNVGTYCDELGIHERVLLDIVNRREIDWPKLSAVFVMNGVIMELCELLKNKKYEEKVTVVFHLLNALFDVDLGDLEKDDVTLRRRRERMLFTGKTLKKSKRKGHEQALSDFERTFFDLPVKSQTDTQGQAGGADNRGSVDADREGMDVSAASD